MSFGTGAVSPQAPTVLRGIAAIGVVVALIGTIVIWMFLGDLEETTDRSLLIGEQAAVALPETIDIADQVLDAVDDGLVSVESTLGTLEDMLAATVGLAEATGDLSATLPESFTDIDAALSTVERLGQTVDSTLAALSRIPFGPEYTPETSFPDAIAGLREALDPIAENLTTISSELGSFADGSGTMTAELEALISDVQSARRALVGTDALLDDYRAAASDAGDLAATTRNQLASSMTRMRIVVVALGLLLVLSQYVPWTLAALLQSKAEAREVVLQRVVIEEEPDPLVE